MGGGEGADVANFKIEGRFRDTRGEDHYRCTWVVRKGGEKEPGEKAESAEVKNKGKGIKMRVMVKTYCCRY